MSITLSLVERFRRARPDVPLSFSAGVDNRNFADCVALGLAPVTVCTDLLKPGGYGRLPKYLENLEERMRALGVRHRWRTTSSRSCGQGEQAITAVRSGLTSPRRTRSRICGRRRTDLRELLTAASDPSLHDVLVRQAAVLNTPLVVARAVADPRYRAESLRPPRRIGSHLRAVRLCQLRQVPASVPQRCQLRLRGRAHLDLGLPLPRREWLRRFRRGRALRSA